MPRVARFSIAPVSSLGLEHPDEIELTEVGVVEDRRFYLIDDTGRHIDRLVIGPLVQIAAHADPEATRLRLDFPDGTVVDEEVRLGNPIETQTRSRSFIGHEVDGPWAEPLSAFAGRRLRLIRVDRPGGTRTQHHASLISDGSLAALAGQLDEVDVDARRFRMLIELEGAQAHEEDRWVGHRIRLGEAVLRVTKPDARCAITTQDPDTGVRDLDTLRGIIAYRGLRDGEHADFGVLADVDVPGRVALGDEVVPVD